MVKVHCSHKTRRCVPNMRLAVYLYSVYSSEWLRLDSGSVSKAFFERAYKVVDDVRKQIVEINQIELPDVSSYKTKKMYTKSTSRAYTPVQNQSK